MKIATKLILPFLLISAVTINSCGGKGETVTSDGDEKPDKKTSETKADIPAGAMKIGFIRSDSINEKYLYLIDRKKELENESMKTENALKAEYNRMMKKQQDLEAKYKFMTLSEQQAAQEEMMKMGEKYRVMEEKASLEFQEKNAFFQKQLYENVEAFLGKYAEENGFDYIFRYEMGLNLMYGSSKYDITSDVLKGLNDEYRGAMK